jgi:hypothetical protein
VYKASRRREYERLRQMDEDVRKEKEGDEWEREKREREERDREKTRKNREKREKLKKRKGGKGGKDEANGTSGGGIKPRVQVGGTEGCGGEGKEDHEMRGMEEVGVIIHDDD